MSKIVEEAALEYCREHNIESFSSQDIDRLHEIYDKAKRHKGFKPLKNNHPLNILRRIRNSMRTGYYFDKLTLKIGGKKVCFFDMKGRRNGSKVISSNN